VRAIHYYDRIGLVTPSVRTDGGHRIYSDDDIERLCAVALLRMAGQSTSEIGECLAGPDWNLSSIIESQVARLDRQLTALGTLRHRLSEVARDDSWSGPGFSANAQRVLATPYATRKAVALLPYTDVDQAQRWLGDVFRLAPGPTEQDPDGTIRYASVITGQGLVHLHEATDGFQPPAVAGVCTAMIVVSVDDLDQLAEHIAANGARISHGPADMDYGVRELGASDLAGHVWCFHQTLQSTGEQP
jgi:DNA-binding transcriptional MerR regulator/predicted enzyme related to lactoylglutathione lyase